jgi:hypothetical protein
MYEKSTPSEKLRTVLKTKLFQTVKAWPKLDHLFTETFFNLTQTSKVRSCFVSSCNITNLTFISAQTHRNLSPRIFVPKPIHKIDSRGQFDAKIRIFFQESGCDQMVGESSVCLELRWKSIQKVFGRNGRNRPLYEGADSFLKNEIKILRNIKMLRRISAKIHRNPTIAEIRDDNKDTSYITYVRMYSNLKPRFG